MAYTPGDVITLPITEVNPYKEQKFGPYNGGGYDDFFRSPEGLRATDGARQHIIKTYSPLVRAALQQAETTYAAQHSNISETVKKEIEDAGGTNGTLDSTTEALDKETHIRENIVNRKTTELQSKKIIADSFYRADFFSRALRSFLSEAIPRHLYGISHPPQSYQAWLNSLQAAYAMKLLNEQIALLHSQIAWLKAQADAARATEQQEARAIRAANTFRISTASGSAQLSAAAGSIALAAGASLTLDAAIQAAIQTLKGLAAAALDRATGVGIGLLLYSPTLGNSDLYPTTLTLPASGLAPQLPNNLPQLAAAGGTVELPYRIYGNHAMYSVVAGGSAKVPVRAVTFDTTLDAYTFTTADTPPRTLVFPIATPPNSSTISPAQPVDVPVYAGVTLTPIEVIAEGLPAIDPLDIHDGIYVFPEDSGIAPIYAVFSEPLDSGRFTRSQLQKKYGHAADFGVTDENPNNESLRKFRDAVEAHLLDRNTVEKGTYHHYKGSKVFFNTATNVVVILTDTGKFLSGWELKPGTDQYTNYINGGAL